TTPFTDASVTVTATADTSMVMNLGSGLFQVTSLTASVSVTGLGTATFTGPTRTFDNQPVPGAGISTLAGPDILDVINNPALAPYDLTTSIGPLTGTPAFNPGMHFATTSGDFVLNSVTGNTTFQATAQPAPEPSALALFSLGAAALAGWRW